MNEPIISFQLAKLAKDKGFDWECIEAYIEDGSMWCEEEYGDLFGHNVFGNYSAPSQSFLQKWLRDKYCLIVTPITDFVSWQVRVQYPNLDYYDVVFGDDGTGETAGFYSYEDALEFGLQKALLLIY